MNNKFFPSSFKDKLTDFIRYFYGILFLIITIILLLSLLSFNIEDNSFLTHSSNQTNNFIGTPGSFISSFLFYTFGIMGYTVVLFFFIYSLSILLNKRMKYFFIRYLIFTISLILMPQIFIYWKNLGNFGGWSWLKDFERMVSQINIL